jgi:hypothetical protein
LNIEIGRLRDYIGSQQCKKEAEYRRGTLCKLHRQRKVRRRNTSGETTLYLLDSSFPRLYTDEEERKWVDQARRHTSPEANINGCCVVCRTLKEMDGLSIVTELELLLAWHLLCCQSCYKQVPDFYFQYKVGHSRLDRLVLDAAGFVEVDKNEGFDGAPVMAQMCTEYR